MYDAICLASGGLDSLVCLHLLRGKGLSALPVFIHYGQRNFEREFHSLRSNVMAEKFAEPVLVDVSGFGSVIRSGLTDRNLRVLEDAFTPNRNLLFLTIGGAVAYSRGVSNLVLGFLSEKSAIFPDQTDLFLQNSATAISASLGVDISISCPLRDFTKRDVVSLAKRLGVNSYYSCHAGTSEPCGLCIACREYESGD